MMQPILEGRNRALLHDVAVVRQALHNAQIADELVPYRDSLLALCDGSHARIQRNLSYLGLEQPQILGDILSETQGAIQAVRLLSSLLAIPVLRGEASDRLCLKLIHWLHTQHAVTKRFPAAFSDGNCAIWPFISFNPIYYFPCIEQRGLLFLSLFFHEFGHLLYACHRPEMDDLVGELQRRIHVVLVPVSQRNDAHAEEQSAQRQVIINTWYSWIQELFCDTVGFIMAGPCYLHAFSAFVSTMDPTDFSHDPQRSSHPVTMLRIRFLAERAAAAGFADLAERIEGEWETIAQTIGVVEDYQGVYDDALADPILRTIEDMLTETSPRRYLAKEVDGEYSDDTDSFVPLLNAAWHVYLGDPDRYDSWETAQIRALLQSSS